ncbi:MAG: hypothetical protein ABL867_11670, partial [Rickettsiales bacterium]
STCFGFWIATNATHSRNDEWVIIVSNYYSFPDGTVHFQFRRSQTGLCPVHRLDFFTLLNAFFLLSLSQSDLQINPESIQYLYQV